MLATHDWCGHEADVPTCFLKKIRVYKVQLEAVELESFLLTSLASLEGDVWPGGREDSSSKCWDETAQRWIGGAVKWDSPAPQFPRTAQNTFVKMCFAKHVLQDVHIKRKSRKYCLMSLLMGGANPNFRRQIPSEFQWNVFHLTLTNPVEVMVSRLMSLWQSRPAGSERFFFGDLGGLSNLLSNFFGGGQTEVVLQCW